MLVGSTQHPAIPAEGRGSTSDSYRVEMLYSEDDTLCRPLGRLYDKLNHEHPRELDWEDRYKSRLNAIGLQNPETLDDRLHSFQAIPRRAYYRLRFAGDAQARLIYVEDVWYANDGNFRSNVWIFVPGGDVEAGHFFNTGQSGGPGEEFQPDKIDLAILFSPTYPRPAGYRRVELPYYFQKIATQSERSVIKSQQNKAVFIPGLTNGTAYIIQRPFLFGSSVVVLAEGGGEFLVYRFKKDQMDDICYFVTSAELNGLRDAGWNSKGRKQ